MPAALLAAQRYGPNPPIGLEGVPQGQGVQADAEPLAEFRQQFERLALSGHRGWVRPGPERQGAAVAAADQPQGPAGIDFAVVALARAVEQGAFGPGPTLQLLGQGPGIAELGGAIGGHVPLRPIRFEGHQGWLPTHGELHAGLAQALFDYLSRAWDGLTRSWDRFRHGWLGLRGDGEPQGPQSIHESSTHGLSTHGFRAAGFRLRCSSPSCSPRRWGRRSCR